MKYYSLIILTCILIFNSCEDDNLKYEDRYILEGYVEININGLSLDGDQINETERLQEFKKGFEDIYSGYRETENNYFFSVGRLDATDESSQVIISFNYNKNSQEVNNINFDARYRAMLPNGKIYFLDIDNSDTEEIQITEVNFNATDNKLRGNYTATIILEEGATQRTLVISGSFSCILTLISK